MREKKPLGTGFVVSMLAPIQAPVYMHSYVVSAAHGLRNEHLETWVRFNCEGGRTHDEPVPKWYCHPTQDVAVFPLGHIDAPVVSATVPTFAFLDAERPPDLWPQLGDRVYFIGLLSSLTAMAEANIPMVRSGSLGRMYQENIPLRIGPNEMFNINKGHLIDCRSYQGFSGSPCFVQFQPGHGKPLGDATALLGLMAGHFDDWVEAEVTGDIFGTVRTPVNTGVGIVVPAEAITDALNLDELVELRERRPSAPPVPR
jgi:hypothetical protein